MKRTGLWISIVLGLGLILASWQQWLPIPLTEALGFVTGAACVYLVVQQSIWNFPLGIANNIFFLILFGQARLFADAGLQIVYIVLGVHGWYQWLHGGAHRTPLKITRASWRLWAVLLSLIPVATWGLVLVLRRVNGAAPVPDAFTTVLSLGAQYLLNRKLLENWVLWIVADVIYIYLYITRGLHLTAVLYFVFLCLCIAGLVRWRQTLRSEEAAPIG
jgi:nicotinamide mononucleotide transporter